MIDMRIEVVMVPVTDVDRAKAFYERVGFNLDVDHKASEEFRVVQLTPPGSSCSVTFGVGVGAGDPGALKGTHLVVSDMAAAVDELANRGIEVQPVRHMTPDGWTDGPDPEHANYNTFSGFEDPDGNTWIIQEVGYGLS